MCTSEAYGSSDKLFLGLIKRAYVATLFGLVHGVSSLATLAIGNLLCFTELLLGSDVGNITTSKLVLSFFACHAISVGVIRIFYWDKIPSWQLATTSPKEKGLTPKQLRKFNKGRGVVSQLLFCMYPLALALSPPQMLESVAFSRILAVNMLLVFAHNYLLFRDYGRALLVAYGLSQVGLALSILSHGSIADLSSAYPRLLDVVEKEAFFVATAVQFGYFWYYLYSRGLASKDLVQDACKRYHPGLFYLFVFRHQRDAWWSALPRPMWFCSILMTMLAGLFAFKIVKAQFKEGAKEQGEKQGRRRRRSSIFEVEDSVTRRRSSIFESIN